MSGNTLFFESWEISRPKVILGFENYSISTCSTLENSVKKIFSYMRFDVDT